jgi:hypothetical protein
MQAIHHVATDIVEDCLPDRGPSAAAATLRGLPKRPPFALRAASAALVLPEISRSMKRSASRPSPPRRMARAEPSGAVNATSRESRSSGDQHAALEPRVLSLVPAPCRASSQIVSNQVSVASSVSV